MESTIKLFPCDSVPKSLVLTPCFPRRSVVAAASLALLAACTNDEPRSYQGYAEGEYVRVAAPFSGR